MSLITFTDWDTGVNKYFTPEHANAFKDAVNDNHARIAALEEINILDPDDQTWQGRISAAVAGESMSAANRWAPLYAKDTGSGTRFYLYNADTDDPDNDTYPPVALLASEGPFVAGDAIVIAIGDGILANDDWAAAQAQVGTPLFCDITPGGVSFTIPSAVGDHIKQIATLFNIAANGRDIWEVSFKYPDVVVPI